MESSQDLFTRLKNFVCPDSMVSLDSSVFSVGNPTLDWNEFEIEKYTCAYMYCIDVK